MKLWTIDQLALLPEERAVRKHFDRLNYGTFRWAWRISTLVAFGFFSAASIDGDLVRLGVAALWLAILTALYFLREHPLYEERFTELVAGFLVLTACSMTAVSSDPEFRRVLPTALMPFALLYFRLPKRHCVAVFSMFALTGIVAGFTLPRDERNLAEILILPVFVNALFGGVSMFLSRQARRAFLLEWSGLAIRERERERMSDELADARKIQLAMLPGAAPDVGWLGLASASLPASEVGGDFYDHFILPDGSVAIAIGDVAGHGVGSGLVLAGIKSGLHLLREELRSPVAVLDRLNRLASEWLQWRMLVTLMLAVVDPATRTVRVAAAGHAPLLIVSLDGTARRVGAPALPLGTKLTPSWSEASSALRDGDLLVFWTDGLTELANSGGEQFGEERVEQTLRAAIAAGDGVDAIRDRLLSDLQSFRQDAPQLDDITIVVARFLA